MKWKDFLNTLSGSREIDIVGPFAMAWKPANRPVLYVDGGSRWQKPAPVSATVGDGDSGTAEMDMLLEKEKDFSDFAFALRSLPQNIVHVHTFGFLGGRTDHELANFGEVHAFLLGRLKPCEVTWDDKAVSWSAGHWEFERHGLFSVMVLEKTRVSIEGDCRYPVKAMELLPLSSYGLSNEGHGRIHLNCDRPVLCFKMDEIHVSGKEAAKPQREHPPNTRTRG